MPFITGYISNGIATSDLNQIKLGENVFSGCDLENINITFLDNNLDKEDMTNSISDTKKDENDLELF